jgi:probable HAF family extracellular repeat protein
MFTAVSVHSTMGKGAARRWRALWLVWVVVAWAAQPSLAQRLIWLGTLPGGDWSEAWGVPPMAPWWSAKLKTPQGISVPFAGRRRVGCRTSARWAAIRAGLGAFPPMAPWWSAKLKTPQGIGVPFAGRRRVGCRTSARCRAAGVAGLLAFQPMAPWWSAGLTTPQGSQRAFRWTAAGGMQDLGTLGGDLSAAHWRFRRWLRGGRLGSQRRRASGVPFAGRRRVGCRTSARCRRWASWAHGVSADGSVVVGWAKNPADAGIVPFAGRRLGGCRTSARCRAAGRAGLMGVSADGSVVVGWAPTPQGSGVPFAGRRRVAWRT